MYPSLSGDTKLVRFPFTILPLVKPMNAAASLRWWGQNHKGTFVWGRLRVVLVWAVFGRSSVSGRPRCWWRIRKQTDCKIIFRQISMGAYVFQNASDCHMILTGLHCSLGSPLGPWAALWPRMVRLWITLYYSRPWNPAHREECRLGGLWESMLWFERQNKNPRTRAHFLDLPLNAFCDSSGHTQQFKSMMEDKCWQLFKYWRWFHSILGEWKPLLVFIFTR